jgi:hypothetical protein
MPQPITRSIVNDDLTGRFVGTSTVQNSPIAAAAETIIATVTIPNFGDTPIMAGIRLHGWAAFTVGTNGTAALLKIHQTNASGSTVVSTGALTVTAANLVAFDVLGADAAPGVGTYVLTLQITNGSANTTVSAVHISASMF